MRPFCDLSEYAYQEFASKVLDRTLKCVSRNTSYIKFKVRLTFYSFRILIKTYNRFLCHSINESNKNYWCVKKYLNFINGKENLIPFYYFFFFKETASLHLRRQYLRAYKVRIHMNTNLSIKIWFFIHWTIYTSTKLSLNDK